MTDTHQTVCTIIANTLGVEPSDITMEDDFTLDLNATPQDMDKIKTQIEETLDVSLPKFEEEDTPTTVADLMAVVEDSLL